MPETTPCPQCRETISPEARVCPHCRSSTLVDVCLVSPGRDGRVRYQAARALSGLEAGASFLELQRALGQGAGARLLSQATPAQAARFLATLEEHGLAGRIVEAPASTPAAGRGLGPGWRLGGGIAVGAVVASLAAGLWTRNDPPAETATPATSSEEPVPAEAPEPGATRPLTIGEVAERSMPGMASLRCGDRLGSGFFVGPSELLTNAHVCGEGMAVEIVLSDGRKGSGAVTRSDELLDLALVQAGLTAEPMPLGDAGALEVGSRVVVIGSPMGLDFTTHEGRISRLAHPMLGVSYLQLDARVNPGNSGGPVIDMQGQVVGVLSMKAMGEGLGLALPINYAYTQVSFAAAPSDGPSPGFDQMLAAAAKDEREMLDELGFAGLQPALLASFVHGNYAISALVLMQSSVKPGRVGFDFVLSRPPKPSCEVRGYSESWQAVSNEDAKIPPRMVVWLAKQGIQANLFMANVNIDSRSCPKDMFSGELLLKLGAPGYDSISLGSMKGF